LANADWYCVGGEGVKLHIDRLYPGSARAEVTGSPMFDGLAHRSPRRDAVCRDLGLDPARRVVVYNLTVLDGNYRYLAWRQPSDSRQYEIHRRILGVFGELPEVQFIVKAHPGRGSRASPIEDRIRERGPDNCRVVAEMPFERMIHLADAFVIDCPSTSLLQMAATDSPIYVFNDWFRWDEDAVAALRLRAIVSNDLDGFCSTLATDLGNGRAFERRLTDTTFFRRYANAVEGRAADNLAAFLGRVGPASGAGAS